MTEIRVPCSFEQGELIADHLLSGKKLYMRDDERAWMRQHAHKIHPGCKIISADLDLENCTWVLQVEL